VRVFLDSNVLVSALATRGLSVDVFRLVLTAHQLVLGEVVRVEVRRILKTKFKVPADTLSAIEALLGDIPTVPKPARILAHPEVRDSADAWVLASAVAGGADVLVTGDQDLLVIADVAPLPILLPRAFWEQCRSSR